MRQTKKIKNFSKEYEVIEDLGKGSFGAVIKAKNKVTGNMRAIKIINKSKMDQSEQTRNLLM